MNNESPLEMTFMPSTIEHLGARMYSTLPPVLAELIANSYDADAKEVHIELFDADEKKYIIISDNGHGMSHADINEKFLRIGRNRRNDEQSQTSPGGRRVIGKKGLGKLSFFGIAHRITVETRNGAICNVFSLDWKEITKEDENQVDAKNYSPEIISHNEPCPDASNGTIITLDELQRTSAFDPGAIADSISRLFILDDDFKVFISHNESDEFEVSNDRKYDSLPIEFKWKVPDEIGLHSDYDMAQAIQGVLITTKTPISPKTNMRGVSLFSRGKLVNLPEYFSDSASSHFFSYLTGTLSVDFIDDMDEDIIDTNRQSVNWDHPTMSRLREYLRTVIRWVESEWRKRRAKSQETKIEARTGIDIDSWKRDLPENINNSLNPIISALSKQAELPEQDDEVAGSIKELYKLIPPYPYFHWRNLHPKLQPVVFNYYKSGDYYTAIFEGAKKYINEVKAKSGETITDRALLEKVYKLTNPILSVTEGFKKQDGGDFENLTITNINEGHRMLAIAIWQAFRSPIAHEEVVDLRESGLYTEQHCLDALSLLSHLFSRLEKSTKNEIS